MRVIIAVTGIRHTLAHTICVHSLRLLAPPTPSRIFSTLPLVQVVGKNDSGNGWLWTAGPSCTFRADNSTHGLSKTTLSQRQLVATSTAVEMGGAAHARNSNTWKTDKRALG